MFANCHTGIRSATVDHAAFISAPRDYLTPEEYAGWADLMFKQGAKGLYVFNLFCQPSSQNKWESWNLVTKIGLTPATVAKLPKSVPPEAPRECVLSGWCE